MELCEVLLDSSALLASDWGEYNHEFESSTTHDTDNHFSRI